jgi:hypothetical protein
MQLRGCGISETQHEFVEVIVEFGCVACYLKIVAFFGAGRRNVQMSQPLKYGAGDFAVYLAVEGHRSLPQREDRRIAPQFALLHLDDFSTRKEAAQLLVKGAAVGRPLSR